MGRNHYMMDTKGYCLFCLKLSPKTDDNGQISNERDRDEEIIPNVFSLQRLSHYLRLNIKNIFHEVISVSPASLPVLKKSELKGVLCAGCSELNKTISDITLEMEALKMTLDSCLFKIHDKINGIGKNTKLRDEFRLEMLNNPQTLIHFGIVEQLQKEVLKKCSLLIGKAQPRIILKKCDTSNPVNARPTLPNISKDEANAIRSTSAVSEEEPELCESTPTTSSCHRSKRGALRKTPSTPTLVSSLSREMVMVMVDPLSDHAGTLAKATAPPNFPPTPTVTVPQNTNRQCKFCLKTFRCPWLKRDHERVIHQGIKFHCGYCSATFMLRTSMNRHKKQFHKYGGRSFKIEVEPALDPEPGASAILVPQSAPDPGFNSLECRICRQTFKNSKIRRQHEKTHLGLHFPCDLCSIKFTRRSNMMAHWRRVHKELIRQPVVLTGSSKEITVTDAQASQYQFKTELKDVGELPLQMELATMEEEVEDPLALSTSEITLPVQSSPDTDHNNRFQCKLCRKRFSRTYKLVEHEQTVHQGTVFNRIRTSSSGNNIHLDEPMPGTSGSTATTTTPQPLGEPTSTGALSSLIQTCGTWIPEMTASSTLSSSGTTLPSPPPPPIPRWQGPRFKCKLCPEVYTLLSNLVRHKRQMHNQGRKPKISALQIKIGSSERIELQNEGTSQLPNFLPEDDHTEYNPGGGPESDGCKCQHCNKQFKSLPSLRQHLTTVHNLRASERKFECKFCGKRFFKNYSLLEHQRNVHLGTRYRCQLCPREFTQMGTMKTHMKTTCPNRNRP